MPSRPVHPNRALQAVPGELPFCSGMVFAVEKLWLSRKNCLDTQKMPRLQSGMHSQLRAIGFADGASSL